jgi:hypothetical protein
MKKLATLLLLFSLSAFLAQNKSVAINESIDLNTNAKITSVSYNVNSIKELESIDWNEIKEIFETNKDEQIINLSFGIDLKKPSHKKVTISGKFSVEGKTKDIDNLIEKSKKGIKGLVKMYKKYENN